MYHPLLQVGKGLIINFLQEGKGLKFNWDERVKFIISFYWDKKG